MKYRVGRKQKRVILDENSLEVGFFHKGYEELASKVCVFLNNEQLTAKEIKLLTFLVAKDMNNLKHRAKNEEQLNDWQSDYRKLIAKINKI